MAKQINLHGARAKFGIYNKQTGTTKFLGVFSSVNISTSYEAVPAFILGRFSAATITYTASDLVTISASGWRVLGQGRHTGGGLPALSDLMRHEALTMTVEDRQEDDAGNNPRILVFKEVYPTSSSEGFSARELSTMSLTYIAIAADDEDTVNVESSNAMSLQ